eukprot:gene8941-6273_t
MMLGQSSVTVRMRCVAFFSSHLLFFFSLSRSTVRRVQSNGLHSCELQMSVLRPGGQPSHVEGDIDLDAAMKDLDDMVDDMVSSFDQTRALGALPLPLEETGRPGGAQEGGEAFRGRAPGSINSKTAPPPPSSTRQLEDNSVEEAMLFEPHPRPQRTSEGVKFDRMATATPSDSLRPSAHDGRAMLGHHRPEAAADDVWIDDCIREVEEVLLGDSAASPEGDGEEEELDLSENGAARTRRRRGMFSYGAPAAGVVEKEVEMEATFFPRRGGYPEQQQQPPRRSGAFSTDQGVGSSARPRPRSSTADTTTLSGTSSHLHLYDRMALWEERREMKRMLGLYNKLVAEQSNCTFRPAINQTCISPRASTTTSPSRRSPRPSNDAPRADPYGQHREEEDEEDDAVPRPPVKGMEAFVDRLAYARAVREEPQRKEAERLARYRDPATFDRRPTTPEPFRLSTPPPSHPPTSAAPVIPPASHPIYPQRSRSTLRSPRPSPHPSSTTTAQRGASRTATAPSPSPRPTTSTTPAAPASGGGGGLHSHPVLRFPPPPSALLQRGRSPPGAQPAGVPPIPTRMRDSLPRHPSPSTAPPPALKPKPRPSPAADLFRTVGAKLRREILFGEDLNQQLQEREQRFRDLAAAPVTSAHGLLLYNIVYSERSKESIQFIFYFRFTHGYIKTLSLYIALIYLFNSCCRMKKRTTVQHGMRVPSTGAVCGSAGAAGLKAWHLPPPTPRGASLQPPKGPSPASVLAALPSSKWISLQSSSPRSTAMVSPTALSLWRWSPSAFGGVKVGVCGVGGPLGGAALRVASRLLSTTTPLDDLHDATNAEAAPPSEDLPRGNDGKLGDDTGAASEGGPSTSPPSSGGSSRPFRVLRLHNLPRNWLHEEVVEFIDQVAENAGIAPPSPPEQSAAAAPGREDKEGVDRSSVDEDAADEMDTEAPATASHLPLATSPFIYHLTIYFGRRTGVVFGSPRLVLTSSALCDVLLKGVPLEEDDYRARIYFTEEVPKAAAGGGEATSAASFLSVAEATASSSKSGAVGSGAALSPFCALEAMEESLEQQQRAALESLELDRYLFAPDLLYDLERLQQRRLITSREAVLLDSFADGEEDEVEGGGGAATKKKSGDSEEDGEEEEELKRAGASTRRKSKKTKNGGRRRKWIRRLAGDQKHLGRGSAINTHIPKPYVQGRRV